MVNLYMLTALTCLSLTSSVASSIIPHESVGLPSLVTRQVNVSNGHTDMLDVLKVGYSKFIDKHPDYEVYFADWMCNDWHRMTDVAPYGLQPLRLTFAHKTTHKTLAYETYGEDDNMPTGTWGKLVEPTTSRKSPLMEAVGNITSMGLRFDTVWETLQKLPNAPDILHLVLLKVMRCWVPPVFYTKSGPLQLYYAVIWPIDESKNQYNEYLFGEDGTVSRRRRLLSLADVIRIAKGLVDSVAS